jgi:small subunit ribosomal protein S18
MSKPEPKEADVEQDSGRKKMGRRKACKFCADENLNADRGKLVPRRLTGNCAKHQREIGRAVSRARMIALMPFAVTGN